MKSLKYIIIAAFILMSTSTYADTVQGCQINSQAFIYDLSVGVQEFPVSQYYKPSFQTYSQGSTAEFLQAWYNPNNCPHFGSVSIGSPQCAVQGITYADAGGMHNLGNTVTYQLVYPSCAPEPVNLPLDDYTWAILLAIGGIGAYLITKKQLLVV